MVGCGRTPGGPSLPAPPPPAVGATHATIQPSSPRFFFSSVAAANPSTGSHHRIAIAVDLSDESAYAVQNYLRPGDAVIDAFTTTKAQDLAQPQIPFKIHIVKDHDMKERLCLEVEAWAQRCHHG